jgi:predicted ATPase
VPSPPDRITRVRFAGLRTAASVELDLEGLTVLIGPNGVGKSSLIEGFELLRRVMASDDLVRTLHEDHGGPASLVSHGEHELRLGVDVTTEEVAFSYEMVLGRGAGGFGITHESLHKGGRVFDRTGDSITAPNILDTPLRMRRPQESALRWWSMNVLSGVGALLEGIEVHGSFSASAGWLRGFTERSARSDNVVQSTSRVERGGTNLPNAYHALRNRDDWQDTLETIRLVVDEDIRDVLTPASASGGSIGLALRYRTSTVPAFALSDGTLSLLSLVAITKLDGVQPSRSLLVLDEPDLHLHPSAIRYVVGLLEQ